MTPTTPRSTAGWPSSCRPAGRAAAWSPQKLHFLAALPRIDGRADADAVGVGVEDLVERVRKAWGGSQGPKLRLLPERIELARLHEQVQRTGSLEDQTLYLAIDERDLAPVGLDIDREPHLLAFGDSRSGKSALLRTYAREVMRTRTAQQAQVVVVDYRRSLLGEVPDDYQLHYLTSATQAEPAIAELAAYLQQRLPGPDVTPDQLRNRSWWTGAEVYVVIDDYDLVATAVRVADPAAGAAARPGARRRPAPGARPALRWCGPGALRAGHPEPARPGHAGPAALRQPGRGPAHRHGQAPQVGARPGPAGHPGPRRRGRADRLDGPVAVGR